MREVRTANADNEYTAMDGFSPVYDANGNTMEPNASTEYVYDWANRLFEVRQNAQTVATFRYDALNRRVAKSAGAVTTRYVHSGPHIVEEYENGVAPPARIHIHAPDNAGAPLVALLANGSELWHLTDRQGSVMALADAAGAVVETRTYTAYGAMTAYDTAGTPLATVASAYGYTGQRWDAESALWNYRNRMYSPDLGRFLQRDPVGYFDGANLYAYVRNNPVLYTDPDGLMARGALDAGGNGIGNTLQGLAYPFVRGYLEAASIPDRGWQNANPLSSAFLPYVLADYAWDSTMVVAGVAASPLTGDLWDPPQWAGDFRFDAKKPILAHYGVFNNDDDRDDQVRVMRRLEGVASVGMVQNGSHYVIPFTKIGIGDIAQILLNSVGVRDTTQVRSFFGHLGAFDFMREWGLSVLTDRGHSQGTEVNYGGIMLLPRDWRGAIRGIEEGNQTKWYKDFMGVGDALNRWAIGARPEWR